jgi:hypothetical protein
MKPLIVMIVNLPGGIAVMRHPISASHANTLVRLHNLMPHQNRLTGLTPAPVACHCIVLRRA